MAKTITLSLENWHTLQEKIVEDHGRTILIISWRLREQLGFTVRQHSDYSGDSTRNWNTIQLDF